MSVFEHTPSKTTTLTLVRQYVIIPVSSNKDVSEHQGEHSDLTIGELFRYRPEACSD